VRGEAPQGRAGLERAPLRRPLRNSAGVARKGRPGPAKQSRSCWSFLLKLRVLIGSHFCALSDLRPCGDTPNCCLFRDDSVQAVAPGVDPIGAATYRPHFERGAHLGTRRSKRQFFISIAPAADFYTCIENGKAEPLFSTIHFPNESSPRFCTAPFLHGSQPQSPEVSISHQRQHRG
jgi:hypothetical protein